MKILKITALCTVTLCAPATPALAETSAGFGADQGLGITAQFDQRVNLFIGNDGIAADYLVRRGSHSPVEGMPLNWYVGGGVWADWDSGFGVRLPLGLELEFAPKWHVFGQIAPDLDLDDGASFGLGAGIGVRYAL